jgi:4-hydroxybenzoate polyprenyltransferase
VATLAGADPATATRLALSMLCLQASIGALNDLVDAPIDAGRKPGKPLPRGVVTRRAAWLVTVVGGGAGLALSWPSGAATLAVAAAGAGLGYLYDLRLSRGPISWLPLALALPLLPVHAWLGATGTVPPGLVTLVPAAVLAGFGLALGNGLVDVERDAASGRRGIVVALGPPTARLLSAGALGLVVVLAWLVAPGAVGAPGALGTLRSTGVPIGGAAIILGAAALRARSAGLRERGWELEAIGVATIGIAWLAGTAGSAPPV